MSTLVRDEAASRSDERARQRAPAASSASGSALAAVAVLAIIGVPILVNQDSADRLVEPPSVPDTVRFRAVLDVPDWRVEAVWEGPRAGEIRYTNADQELRVRWISERGYSGRVASWTETKGQPDVLSVLGEESRLWAGSAEHTVVRPVRDGYFLEVRGSGMSEPAYTELLGELRQVDAPEFGASLPEDVVLPGRVDDAILAMLDEVDPPPGFDLGAVEVPGYSDRYEVAAAVTSAVTCAWVAHYERARLAGDQAAVDEAVTAMAASRGWPVLQEMQETPAGAAAARSIWDAADAMAAGLPGGSVLPPGVDTCADGR